MIPVLFSYEGPLEHNLASLSQIGFQFEIRLTSCSYAKYLNEFEASRHMKYRFG